MLPITWIHIQYLQRAHVVQRVFLRPVETPSGLEVTFRSDADSLIDSLMSNLASSPANELDGAISDALRNFLFGRPGPNNPMGGQDLVGRNIFRSREVNLPTYAGLAECFGVTPDAQVRPGSSLSRNTLTRPAACARCCRFQLIPSSITCAKYIKSPFLWVN